MRKDIFSRELYYMITQNRGPLILAEPKRLVGLIENLRVNKRKLPLDFAQVIMNKVPRNISKRILYSFYNVGMPIDYDYLAYDGDMIMNGIVGCMSCVAGNWDRFDVQCGFHRMKLDYQMSDDPVVVSCLRTLEGLADYARDIYESM